MKRWNRIQLDFLAISLVHRAVTLLRSQAPISTDVNFVSDLSNDQTGQQLWGK